MSPHADDEREAEFLPIGLIEPMETLELLPAQPIQAEPALFGLRFRGEVGTGDPAAKLGMATDEGELPAGGRR
jgi:hypothetical protein